MHTSAVKAGLQRLFIGYIIHVQNESIMINRYLPIRKYHLLKSINRVDELRSLNYLNLCMLVSV